MPEKRCYQFTVKNKVQGVSLRLAIARLIPDELDVRADNQPNGSVKVYLRGHEEDVKKFWKALQREVLGKAENPTFSGVHEIAGISIDTDRFYHRLQCEQMEKFIDVGFGMRDSIDTMGNRIGAMGSNIAQMSDKIDKLPQNMAKEIIRLKKEGVF